MEQLAFQFYNGNNTPQIQQQYQQALNSQNGFEWSYQILSSINKQQNIQISLFSLKILRHWIFKIDPNDQMYLNIMNQTIQSIKLLFQNRNVVFVKCCELLTIVLCRKFSINDSLFSVLVSFFNDNQFNSTVLFILKILLEDLFAEKNTTNIMTSQQDIVKQIVSNDQKNIIQLCINSIQQEPKIVIDVLIPMMKVVSQQTTAEFQLFNFYQQLLQSNFPFKTDVFDCVIEMINNPQFDAKIKRFFYPLLEKTVQLNDEKSLVVISTFVKKFGIELRPEIVLTIFSLLIQFAQNNTKNLNLISQTIELIKETLNLEQNKVIFRDTQNYHNVLLTIFQIASFASFNCFNKSMDIFDLNRDDRDESEYSRLINSIIDIYEQIYLFKNDIVNTVMSKMQEVLNGVLPKQQHSEMDILDLNTCCYYFIFVQPKYLSPMLAEQKRDVNEIIKLYQSFFTLMFNSCKISQSPLIVELAEQLTIVMYSFNLLVAKISNSNEIKEFINGMMEHVFKLLQQCQTIEIGTFYIKSMFELIEEVGCEYLQLPFSLQIVNQPLQFFNMIPSQFRKTAIVSFLQCVLTCMKSATTQQKEFLSMTFQNVLKITCFDKLYQSVQTKNENDLKYNCQVMIELLEKGEFITFQKQLLCVQFEPLMKMITGEFINSLSSESVYLVTNLMTVFFKSTLIVVSDEVVSHIIEVLLVYYQQIMNEILQNKDQMKTNGLCLCLKLISIFMNYYMNVKPEDWSETIESIMFICFIFCRNDIANMLPSNTGSEVFREGFKLLFDVIELFVKKFSTQDENGKEFAQLCAQLICFGIGSTDIAMTQLICERMTLLERKVKFFTNPMFVEMIQMFYSEIIKSLASKETSRDVLIDLVYLVLSKSQQHLNSFIQVIQQIMMDESNQHNQIEYIQHFVQYLGNQLMTVLNTQTSIYSCQAKEMFKKEIRQFIHDYTLLH